MNLGCALLPLHFAVRIMAATSMTHAVARRNKVCCDRMAIFKEDVRETPEYFQSDILMDINRSLVRSLVSQGINRICVCCSQRLGGYNDQREGQRNDARERKDPPRNIDAYGISLKVNIQ